MEKSKSKYKFWNGMTLTEMFGKGNEPTDAEIEKILERESRIFTKKLRKSIIDSVIGIGLAKGMFDNLGFDCIKEDDTEILYSNSQRGGYWIRDYDNDKAIFVGVFEIDFVFIEGVPYCSIFRRLTDKDDLPIKIDKKINNAINQQFEEIKKLGR